MAHHKSALKRIRQNVKRRIYNRRNKRMMKLAIKAVKSCKTYEEALEKLQRAYSVLDRVAAHGVIHKNNAARRKSRLTAFVNKLKVTSN